MNRLASFGSFLIFLGLCFGVAFPKYGALEVLQLIGINVLVTFVLLVLFGLCVGVAFSDRRLKEQGAWKQIRFVVVSNLLITFVFAFIFGWTVALIGIGVFFIAIRQTLINLHKDGRIKFKTS